MALWFDPGLGLVLALLFDAGAFGANNFLLGGGDNTTLPPFEAADELAELVLLLTALADEMAGLAADVGLAAAAALPGAFLEMLELGAGAWADLAAERNPLLMLIPEAGAWAAADLGAIES